MESYLFSSHIMYKSHFWKMYPYDWFYGPGSHIWVIIIEKSASYVWQDFDSKCTVRCSADNNVCASVCLSVLVCVLIKRVCWSMCVCVTFTPWPLLSERSCPWKPRCASGAGRQVPSCVIIEGNVATVTRKKNRETGLIHSNSQGHTIHD